MSEHTVKSEFKVELLAGTIGERVRAVWEGNLQQLDWEQDFLAPFRTKSAKGGYIGLGKTISGLVHAARHFGGAADVLRRRIVGELLKTQTADGYIGLYLPASRTYKCWDVHEQAYIIQALLENAERFGDSECLQAAERLGRWLLPRLEGGRWRGIDGDDGESNVARWKPMTIIGLDRALAALSQATGDTVIADFCRDEIAVPDWCDPIVEGRHGEICGHAYAYLARCLAQLETSDGMNLPNATRAVIGYLRAGGGLVICGTCGQSECWHSDQRLDGELGETCTTAYLVRWAAHLLRRTHDAWFGDLMERAIYNALFAASSVDGRRIRYYSAGAGVRRWYEADTFCCPGNYRRIVGELPDFIARPYDAGLALDLYEACRLTCPVGNQTVQLRVTTDYPFDHVVTIDVVTEQPTAFPLYLRCPGWADGVSVSVNGQALSVPPRQGWIRLARTWRSGDRVELAFGMPWRLIRGFRRQSGRIALMRGPVVWGADPADNAELGDRLPEIVPDRSTCCLSDSARRTTVKGALDSRQVDVALVPFAALDTAVTYFSGRRGMGDERDHLLWLEPGPVGVGPRG